MYVRVFDKSRKSYFKSVVYATVGEGWFLQYIVLNPNTYTFELVDDLDKSVTPAKSLVEIIQPEHFGFSVYDNSSMLKYKFFCEKNGIEIVDIKKMMGYPDVCENVAFLADIFIKRSIPVGLYEIARRDLEDLTEWNYILTQADADKFMKLFAGFHDSTLEKVNYLETMDSISLRTIASANAIFNNSGWFGVAELCFEGIQMLRIMPTIGNYSREIYDATLSVENESVFWADSYMEKADTSYGGSIIKALSLKWRKI